MAARLGAIPTRTAVGVRRSISLTARKAVPTPGKDGFSVLQEDGALLRQHDAARMTGQEGDAQLLLEVLDLKAERRLCQMQDPGSAREAAHLGNLAE